MGSYGDPVAILTPFEELTKNLSSYDALASVIPAVTVLVRLLNRETDEDHGVKTMKATLLAAIKKRFSGVETNPLYFISTILDPRFKDGFFSNNTAPEAKLHLKQELQMMSRAEAEGSRAEAAEPPAKLFLKAPASTSSSLDTVFDEIAKEQPQAAQPLAAGAAIELDKYLGEAPSPCEDSPLKYWGVNKIRFPTLAKIARKYLSVPCSSVESERLFSSVSHIIDEKRNSLTADNAEKLLFLKKKPKPATHLK
ncbi:unnamed protein product [Oreochromis niloticus]|nr:unnamed protein product [Mustela putorius furo]